MAEGILGLGSRGAASLNQDLIDKLKTAERKATVEPLETSIESITNEKEVFTTIDEKVNEVLDAIKVFDLFVSGGATAFDQKTATAAGTSVTFDAPDVSALNEGVTTVDIKSLAQKDAYQSNAIDSSTKDLTLNLGNLDITVGGELTSIDTVGKNYDELATEIDAIDGVNASLEQVGSDSYRLVIKSSESGIDNKLTIAGDAAVGIFDFPTLPVAQSVAGFGCPGELFPSVVLLPPLSNPPFCGAKTIFGIAAVVLDIPFDVLTVGSPTSFFEVV